ncbi:helix-turn-helix transcriptional regulator [Hymenobacter lapidiphilus]|uniref:Helix-turn-helix transcriptional regulator n=1 Tax=Hymenobacter lapidiphilus TaxID=2608003 RepID=A0A7Y7PL13_9BACT|nr:helix-turn-helix transcriptional regulator [Hymenobacter lapidiphilus]NVO29695.1 helix-turn-helix transcriptional regulator [Hymenobacter lapidiphilus]
MKPDEPLQFYSLDEVVNEHIGPLGTPRREAFEEELRLDLLGKAIKEARLQRHLTQQQLGELVGVQKAQISKLENNLTDARFDTVMKVFKALNAKVNFSVELLNQGAAIR